MTNVEVLQAEATDLMNENKLNGYALDFIKNIIVMDKKELRGLTKKQYITLKKIVNNRI